MKALLLVLVLVVASVVCLGFYLGWFQLTVDTDKFQEDRKKVLGSVQNLGHQVKDKAAALTENNDWGAGRPARAAA